MSVVGRSELANKSKLLANKSKLRIRTLDLRDKPNAPRRARTRGRTTGLG
jgi:hypothetical protein